MMHTRSWGTDDEKMKYDQSMRIAGVFLLPEAYVNSFNE